MNDVLGDHSNSVGVQGRFYPTNSFYLSSGLFYRQGMANLYGGIPGGINKLLDSTFGGYTGPTELTYSDMVVNVAVGNQWQWDLVNIGVEWFGIQQPIRTFSQRQNKSATEAEGQQSSKILVKTANMITYTVLTLHAGVAF